jgi:hypothetical protein
MSDLWKAADKEADIPVKNGGIIQGRRLDRKGGEKMSCPDYRKMSRQKIYYGCFPGEMRFTYILPERPKKRKPGPKPKGHPDYHPPKITKKMGRPRKEKAPKERDRRDKMLSAAEADRRIREQDRLDHEVAKAKKYDIMHPWDPEEETANAKA